MVTQHGRGNAILGWLSCLAIVTLLGCGPSGHGEPSTVPVEGVITYKGKKLPRGELSFFPVNGGYTGQATVSGGFFTAESFGETGLEEGEYIVTVDAFEDPMMSNPNREPKRLVPESFSDREQSSLRITVTAEQENYLIEIP